MSPNIAILHVTDGDRLYGWQGFIYTNLHTDNEINHNLLGRGLGGGHHHVWLSG